MEVIGLAVEKLDGRC